MDRRKTPKKFSESFKREKVSQIESGKITVSQLAKMLDMSPNPIYVWLKKYGKEPPAERIVIESESDFVKFVEAQKENENLLKLIGKQQILIDYYTSLIKEAGTHYNVDLEKVFKKKL